MECVEYAKKAYDEYKESTKIFSDIRHQEVEAFVYYSDSAIKFTIDTGEMNVFEMDEVMDMLNEIPDLEVYKHELGRLDISYFMSEEMTQKAVRQVKKDVLKPIFPNITIAMEIYI